MYSTCTRHEADIVAHGRVRSSLRQLLFELRCFSSREVVPTADNVAPMRVGLRIEVGKEGEHFCRVAAAAKNDEKARGVTTLAGERPSGVYGGEDVEEAEL